MSSVISLESHSLRSSSDIAKIVGKRWGLLHNPLAVHYLVIDPGVLVGHTADFVFVEAGVSERTRALAIGKVFARDVVECFLVLFNERILVRPAIYHIVTWDD